MTIFRTTDHGCRLPLAVVVPMMRKAPPVVTLTGSFKRALLHSATSTLSFWSTFRTIGVRSERSRLAMGDLESTPRLHEFNQRVHAKE